MIAYVGLRGGREDRLRQLLGLLQPGRQLDAADGAGGPVVLPARARDVAAHDALDREHLEPLDQHPAAEDLGGHLGERDDVVGHDVRRPPEPEGRYARQDLALARNRGRMDDVVCGDAVRSDHQEPVARLVDVAYLALRDRRGELYRTWA